MHRNTVTLTFLRFFNIVHFSSFSAHVNRIDKKDLIWLPSNENLWTRRRQRGSLLVFTDIVNRFDRHFRKHPTKNYLRPSLNVLARNAAKALPPSERTLRIDRIACVAGKNETSWFWVNFGRIGLVFDLSQLIDYKERRFAEGKFCGKAQVTKQLNTVFLWIEPKGIYYFKPSVYSIRGTIRGGSNRVGARFFKPRFFPKWCFEFSFNMFRFTFQGYIEI